jgi:hypothetical protein
MVGSFDEKNQTKEEYRDTVLLVESALQSCNYSLELSWVKHNFLNMPHSLVVKNVASKFNEG